MNIPAPAHPDSNPDTDTDTAHGPHRDCVTDPTTRTDDRSLADTWALGEPDADGYQARAVLTTRHHPGHGYTSQLRALRVQFTEDYIRAILDGKTWDFTLLGAVTGKPRFHRPTLTNIHDRARTELRRRYDDADPDVCTYFDPQSAHHTR